MRLKMLIMGGGRIKIAFEGLLMSQNLKLLPEKGRKIKFSPDNGDDIKQI